MRKTNAYKCVKINAHKGMKKDEKTCNNRTRQSALYERMCAFAMNKMAEILL